MSNNSKDTTKQVSNSKQSVTHTVNPVSIVHLSILNTKFGHMNVRIRQVSNQNIEWKNSIIYHILVDYIAKILPCDKSCHVYFTQFHKNGLSGLIKRVY
jgi:hypothetical protein